MEFNKNLLEEGSFISTKWEICTTEMSQKSFKKLLKSIKYFLNFGKEQFASFVKNNIVPKEHLTARKENVKSALKILNVNVCKTINKQKNMVKLTWRKNLSKNFFAEIVTFQI